MSTTYSRRHMLKLAGLGAGSLGLGALSACAPSSSSDDESGDSASEQPTEPQDFTFAAWVLADEVFEPTIEQLMSTFGDDKGVSVEGAAWAYNDYLNQLTLQMRGDQLMGAAQLDIAWLGSIAALGKLKDLSGFAQGRGYTDAALSSSQYDGVQYGLPWTTAAIGLITNTELLDNAGIGEVPTNVEDFEAALAELRSDDVIPYAAMTKAAQLKDILIWMETFGCPIIEDGKVAIGDDASVDAVTWYKRLYDQGLIAPDVERLDARTLYSQGRTAIYDDAIVAKGLLLSESPDPDLESKMNPASRPTLADGETPRAHQWGHTVVVIDDEGGDTAAEFAQWLTSDEQVVLDYFEEFALPPTTEAALASDTVQSDEFAAAFTERVTATATPNPFWQYAQYAQMETAVAEQVQAVLVGDAAPSDAMTAAGEAVRSLID